MAIVEWLSYYPESPERFADFVPVGKDQIQHLEIPRDIASAFNHKYGKEIFVLPKVKVEENVMIVPGTDGQKMSKSYNNFINIFLPEKELKKVVMGIVSDSKALEEPKDPDTDNTFKLYKLLATAEQAETMRQNYLKGGFGYGHAKTALFELILDKFQTQREEYHRLIQSPSLLEKELALGENKAAKMANEKLKQVREVLGY